jgi:starch-binding outer membrane protein SusE/F
MTKHFFTTSLLAGMLAISLSSCKKDEIRTTAEFSPAPTLSSSVTNAGVLLRANKANTAVTYTWTPYTFGLSDNTTSDSPVTYTLQFALAGTNFANPYEVVAGGNKDATLTLNVEKLNSAFINQKAPLLKVSQLQVRLKTFVASNEPMLYSGITTISATPYDDCVAPTPDTWSLIGPAGTDWSTDIPLTWNCVDNAYVLRTALKAGDFKFRRNNDWAINLGALAKPIVPGATATPLKPNGEDMTVAAAGTYTIKLTVTVSGAGVSAGTLTVTP